MTIAMLIPTRGRNQNHLDLIESWRKTTKGNSVLIFGLDADDADNYEHELEDAIYMVFPKEGKGMGWITNQMAEYASKNWDAVGFMGDDHRFNNDWETPFIEYLEQTPNGIVYGNDMTNNGESSGLPSAVVMDSGIIRKLGYMFPPTLKHLMIDVFWKRLGEELGTLKYFRDVQIEHVHPFVKKANLDEQYRELNSQELHKSDDAEYQKYLAENFKFDVDRLR